MPDRRRRPPPYRDHEHREYTERRGHHVATVTSANCRGRDPVVGAVAKAAISSGAWWANRQTSTVCPDLPQPRTPWVIPPSLSTTRSLAVADERTRELMGRGFRKQDRTGVGTDHHPMSHDGVGPNRRDEEVDEDANARGQGAIGEIDQVQRARTGVVRA